jgi:tRNA threonylcarbamoyladenosine biosynthesis protein TsaE
LIHSDDDSGELEVAQVALSDEAATLALGAALAAVLPARLTIHLEGDLGAGKTTLVRGLLRGLGFAGNVKSPTYTLVELYAISKLDLYHFDFYRLTDPREFLDAGLDEHFEGDGIRLVEWPDKAVPFVPGPDLRIVLSVDGAGRRASIHADSSTGASCLRALAKGLASAPFPAADS